MVVNSKSSWSENGTFRGERSRSAAGGVNYTAQPMHCALDRHTQTCREGCHQSAWTNCGDGLSSENDFKCMYMRRKDKYILHNIPSTTIGSNYRPPWPSRQTLLKESASKCT